ncbi:MAG: HAMP domain-containing sensor histidine kinase [Oscillospiraceae bacterium]|nr:HAMP domain-containing sensor histidine kinase [Oscillospiraceae bacterium]
MIKKLQRKIFLLLMTVLSVILVSALFTVNSVNHRSDKKQTAAIIDKLMLLTDNTDEHGRKFKNNSALASAQYYVVITDDTGTLRDSQIITSNAQLSYDEISSYAFYAFNDNKEYMRSHHMAYKTLKQNDNTTKIVMLDRTLADETRMQLMAVSLTVAAGGVFLICIFSAMLSRSLVKPVRETFDNQKNFISDVSHEIKTPLAVVNANAEMLEREIGENKWLSYILQETGRMNSLVNSLLDLSRAERDTKEKICESFNISACALKASMVFESIAFEHHLNLCTDITPDIYFDGCKDQIQQLFSILIDNAVDHSSRGTQVKVCLKKMKKKIILSVSNTGEPIPEDEQDKIFERFYRLDKSRNRDENHYGLGLAIAKAIVLQHKGQISVDCDNMVTKFTVTFQSS